MKNKLKKFKKLLPYIAIMVLVPCSILLAEYTLFIEQSPAQGGAVSPGSGSVYSYANGERVTLTATPAEGYEFLYWFGAVSDPGTATTTVSMDGARYVQAVFERTQFENPGAETIQYGGSGPGGLTSSPSWSNTQTSSAASGTPDSGGGGGGEDPYIPVPDPDPVPEPATIAILGTGLAGLLMKRKKH